VSADAGPPLQPPQLSPDGNYVWDGSQWQPIADVANPTHKGVFAAWNSIQVEPADPVAESAKRAPVQVQAPVQMQVAPQVMEPAPDVDYSYSVDDPVGTPLWQQPTKPGKTTYLYVGAGLVIAVMAILILNSLNFTQYLPWSSAGSSSSSVQSPQPTPTADRTRSEFGRADRFLNVSLAPAMSVLDEAVQLMQACNGTLSNSCYDAIRSTEPQVKRVLSVIDYGTIPLCIAAPIKSLRADVANMDVGIQLALKGYTDNRSGEVGNGVSQFNRSAQAAQADVHAADQARKTQCTPDLEGP